MFRYIKLVNTGKGKILSKEVGEEEEAEEERRRRRRRRRRRKIY